MPQQSARTWIWVALTAQFLGYAFDAVWHGLLHPGFGPTTVSEMARHLATVHLPLYLGAVGVLVATATALLQQTRRAAAASVALRTAFGGAVVSTAAEAWHAYSHLRLDTHSGPIAGTLSFVGFVVVVGAMWLSRERRRRGRDATIPGPRPF